MFELMAKTRPGAGLVRLAETLAEDYGPGSHYRFLSPRAQSAADKYGVASITVLAVKPQA